jgi:peptide/nickel transport system permease protein
MRLGVFGTEEQIAALEQELGLNRPLYVQYLDWIGSFVLGDLGQSFVYDQPVVDLIYGRVIRSLQLAAVSTALVVCVGIPLGVLAAKSRDSPLSLGISIAAYVGTSVATFVTGTLLLYAFGGPLFSLFPSGGYTPLKEGIVPWARHMVLPSVTLSIIMMAHIVRQTRSGMTEALQSAYVRTARLKGVRERDVLFNHALRNGLLPTITVLGFNLGWILGGVVVVEVVFSYPGLGQILVEAIQNRDIPVVQAAILLAAVGYTVGNFVADMLYTSLDPRIEYGHGGE